MIIPQLATSSEILGLPLITYTSLVILYAIQGTCYMQHATHCHTECFEVNEYMYFYSAVL